MKTGNQVKAHLSIKQEALQFMGAIIIIEETTRKESEATSESACEGSVYVFSCTIHSVRQKPSKFHKRKLETQRNKETHLWTRGLRLGFRLKFDGLYVTSFSSGPPCHPCHTLGFS